MLVQGQREKAAVQEGYKQVCRGKMRINVDSSARGWEQTAFQGSVQLYQSVNSRDYDENLSVHCVLLIGFLL